MLQAPVLLMVFNRMETTARVFEKIREAKPTKLYIASDGPRQDRAGEDQKVNAIRDYLASNVDWPCEVVTLFRDHNLGTKFGLIEAINWFFEKEEMGIVLEDDCLPHNDFFRFCDEMLQKFKTQTEIYSISGTNINGIWPSDGEYFASMMGGNWGWASWSRAWKKFKMDIEQDRTEENWRVISKNLKSAKLAASVKAHLNKSGSNMAKSAWDYQWLFIRMLEGGKSIVPAKNLISNIGFGEDSTHTNDTQHPLANLQTHCLQWPLHEPSSLDVDVAFDLTYCPYWHKSFIARIIGKLSRTLSASAKSRN